MRKNSFISVSIIAVLLAIAISYILGRNGNYDEIVKAKMEMMQMKSTRDSILAFAAIKDSMQNMLKTEISHLKFEADLLRFKVDSLEEARAEQQLSVRRLRKKEDLQIRLRETFPEMAYSDWGVTEVFNEKAKISVEYLLVPLWFSETFIIDHQNADNYKKQRDKLKELDTLNVQVASLKDSIITLVEQKAEAYKTGYDDAYGKYEILNQKYIDELKKPAFGLPQWGAIVGAAAAGYLVGRK